MSPEGLLASAGINVSLAVVVLSLFSVLKKQRCFAPVYLALRLDAKEDPTCHEGICRFFPSFYWIRNAFRVSEDKVVRKYGLDALAVLRLFKFGIKFFSICSLVGVSVLVPVNYTSQGSYSRNVKHSMDFFSISNIPSGSGRLWVHFLCLCFISMFALYLLYKEYKLMLDKRIQHLHDLRHRPDQFTVLVQGIPLCLEHRSYSCSVDHFFSKHFCPGYHSSQIIYDGQKHEFPTAFVILNSRCCTALVSQSQKHANPLLWSTSVAPEARDILWNNLTIPYYGFLPRKIGVFVAATLLTIFFAIPVTAVQGIVQFERIKKWFPPMKAIQMIPGLNSILTGYLPSAILNSFIYVVPYTMRSMAMFEGYVSRSKTEIKTCRMVFYFLVGNVFFLSVLSGSLLDQIGESFTHPKDFPSHLASAVSSQSDFFISYILTDGLSGFSLEILQFGFVIFHSIYRSIRPTKRNEPYLYGFPYYRVIPIVSLAILIGMVYAVIAPLLLPFLIAYFLLGYAVYLNQMQDVYQINYDSCGQYWPRIHEFIFVALVLMQITMIGLFGLKSKTGAAVSTLMLLIVTVLFNEHCKMRFLPTFSHISIQNAKEMDDRDESGGEIAIHLESAIKAYCQPSMTGMHKSEASPSCMEPLLPS